MRGAVTLVVIGIGILALIAVVRLVLSVNKGAAQDRAMTAEFIANPQNDTTVYVRGWTRSELDQILSDFDGIYDLPKPGDWTVTDGPHGDLVIAFPSDIQPKLLLFLVNYIQYPEKFDLKHRTIGVLCRVTLTSAFGLPAASLVGQKAMIYVPANDTEYDLVYARVESGGAYKIPFTTLIWERVSDPRLPNSVQAL